MSDSEKSKHKIKELNGKSYIFDVLRKKYILLTPEEWVRQNFLDFLINEKKFSKNLIKIETGLKYNALLKRTDIVVYNREGQPLLLIECKAETIKLTKNVLEQASRYNLTLKAKYLCITNGKKTYCFEMNFETNSSCQLTTFPGPE
jgi:hypothetical protein